MNGKPSISEGRGVIIGTILVVALIGFEIFNFDTTKFALLNLLGGLRFVGLEWAAILAFAFCGIDFAGLVRMFTPEQGWDEPREVWLLTGAWLLGATMNAIMTWYAVALAIANRQVGVGYVTQADMQLFAPIFVALLVWLTRILFIGAISVAADRLQQRVERRPQPARRVPVRRAAPQNGSRQAESVQEELFPNL